MAYTTTQKLDSRNWNFISCDADASLIVAGATNGLWTSSDSGANFTQKSADGNSYLAGAAKGSIIIAGIDGDRLNVSTDSGGSWTDLSGGYYPFGGGIAISNDSNKAINLQSSKSTAGYAWGSTSPGSSRGSNTNINSAGGQFKYFGPSLDADGSVGLCGEYGGRLWKCTTFGQYSWSETQPAGANNKNWIASALSSDGSVGYACVYGGRIYKQTGTFTTWAEVRPAGDVDKNWQFVRCSSDGTRVLAGVYGGRVYISYDSGSTWSELQPIDNADHNWSGGYMSDDATKIVLSVYGGYCYILSGTGQADPVGFAGKILGKIYTVVAKINGKALSSIKNVNNKTK